MPLAVYTIPEADGVDIFAGAPIETSISIDENGEAFTSFVRRYGSLALLQVSF